MKLRRSSVLAVVGLMLMMSPAVGQSPQLHESPDGPEHVKVYYLLEDALTDVFGATDRAWTEEWSLTHSEQAAVEARLGLRLTTTEVVFHRAIRDGQDLGWALQVEEKGRFKPITILVHIGPDLTVAKVLVMVYRESRGDGVKRQRFLKQFRGRSANDRLRLNRNVTAVSGATMSSRGLTAGVKRALVLATLRYGADSQP